MKTFKDLLKDVEYDQSGHPVLTGHENIEELLPELRKAESDADAPEGLANDRYVGQGYHVEVGKPHEADTANGEKHGVPVQYRLVVHPGESLETGYQSGDVERAAKGLTYVLQQHIETDTPGVCYEARTAETFMGPSKVLAVHKRGKD